MNIDRTMMLQTDDDNLTELDRWFDRWGSAMDDPEWDNCRGNRYLCRDYNVDVLPTRRNLRRQYLRRLDRISGEPDMYGAHMVMTGPGSGMCELVLEHR